MSQVTLLSVDVTQPIDNTSEGEVFSGHGNDKRFADLVEQHMSSGGKNSRKDKTDSGNSSSAKNDFSTDAQAQMKEAYDNKASKTADQLTENKEYQDENEIGKTLPINETFQDDKPVAEQLEHADSETLLKFLAASKSILLSGTEGEVSDEQLQTSVANELGVDKSTLKQIIESIATTETKAKAEGDVSVEHEGDNALDSSDSKKTLDKTTDARPHTDKFDLLHQIKEQLTHSTSKEVVVKSDASSVTLTSVLSQTSPLNAQMTTEIKDTAEQNVESAESLIDELSIKLKTGDSALLAKESDQRSELSKAASQAKAIELEKPVNVQQSSTVDKPIIDSSAQRAIELSLDDAERVSQAIAAAQGKSTSDKQPQVNAAELNGDSKTQSRTTATEGLANLIGKEQSHSSSNKEQNNSSFSGQSANQQTEEMLIDNDSENGKVEKFERELAEKPLGNRVTESLMQHQLSSQLNTAKAESTYIDEQAHEQFVEHISQRVVKENAQVQKTQLALDTISVYRKDFANEVKEKVMVMINQKLQQVDIQLDPPELGNMHVRVNLQNEQASVSFTVQNQQAKEALELHMSKLKEMLADSGVDVGNADIRKQNQSSQEEQQQGQSHSQGNSHVDEERIDSMSLSANMVKASAVGIDFYA